MSETSAPNNWTARVPPQQWCGQSQPHRDHTWVNGHGLYASCAGHTGTPLPAPASADDAGRAGQ